jgi:bidirectional [NiFe] hydrogenase diaphorase subunit
VPPRDRRQGVTITIDGQEVQAVEGETILTVARRAGIPIPTLCYLDGLSIHGGCRLCSVEVNGDPRLKLACSTEILADMEVRANTFEVSEHRRRLVELLFAEGNHVCATCVSNGACELQDLAVETNVDHIHYELSHANEGIDASHPRYVLDRDRCVRCTRCVRVCAEIEGAAVWEIAERGGGSRLVAEMDVPWGEAESCTSCGKCVQVCPTGALSVKGSAVGEMRHDPDVIVFLAHARAAGEWLHPADQEDPT